MGHKAVHDKQQDNEDTEMETQNFYAVRSEVFQLLTVSD